MKNSNLNIVLSSVNSFEEYQKLKTNLDFLENLTQEVIRRHQLPKAPLVLFSEGTNIVFAYGDSKVIKIFPPFHLDQFKSERLILKALAGKVSVKTPVIEYEGEIVGWPYIVMNQLEGTLLETLWEKLDYNNKTILIRELGSLIKEVHALPTKGLEDIDCHWEKFIIKQIKNCLEKHQSTKLSKHLLQEIPNYLESIKESLLRIKKPVILTGEYTPMNFLVKKSGDIWHINGLIDFGDSMLGLPEYDLLGPGAFLIQGDKQLLKEFLTAYGYSVDRMTDTLSHQLTALMLLHQYSNLNIQIRIKNWQSKVSSMKDLENLVWGF